MNAISVNNISQSLPPDVLDTLRSEAVLRAVPLAAILQEAAMDLAKKITNEADQAEVIPFAARRRSFTSTHA